MDTAAAIFDAISVIPIITECEGNGDVLLLEGMLIAVYAQSLHSHSIISTVVLVTLLHPPYHQLGPIVKMQPSPVYVALSPSSPSLSLTLLLSVSCLRCVCVSKKAVVYHSRRLLSLSDAPHHLSSAHTHAMRCVCVCVFVCAMK